jgi:hypothetical protein
LARPIQTGAEIRSYFVKARNRDVRMGMMENAKNPSSHGETKK